MALQAALDEWSTRASARLEEFVSGLAVVETGDEGDATWVDWLVLRETGDVTPTEEYVFHHGVATRARAGESVPDAAARGAWSPDLRREFVAEGSREEVLAALDRLAAAGYVERVEPATPDDWNGPYWRLTAAGRAARDRLADREARA